MAKIKLKLNSTEEVLLAAYRLSKEDQNEFNEWNLTVETWRLNKNRWGLKGYEEKYPDHKRVMNEIMAKETQKIMGKGWLERTKQNTYRITSLGIAKAKSISGSGKLDSIKRNVNLYDALAPYALDEVFEEYLNNPKEPKNWLKVASFLKLNKYDPFTLDQTLNKIKNAIDESTIWFKNSGETILIRGESISKKPISKKRIINLKKFLKMIEKRFKREFDSIRSKK